MGAGHLAFLVESRCWQCAFCLRRRRFSTPRRQDAGGRIRLPPGFLRRQYADGGGAVGGQGPQPRRRPLGVVPAFRRDDLAVADPAGDGSGGAFRPGLPGLGTGTGSPSFGAAASFWGSVRSASVGGRRGLWGRVAAGWRGSWRRFLPGALGRCGELWLRRRGRGLRFCRGCPDWPARGVFRAASGGLEWVGVDCGRPEFLRRFDPKTAEKWLLEAGFSLNRQNFSRNCPSGRPITAVILASSGKISPVILKIGQNSVSFWQNSLINMF